MNRLHLVMGLAVGLLLTSCSVSQRYHHRGLSIQWRSVGKQVSNKINAPYPKTTDDRTDTKEMETIGAVTKDADDALLGTEGISIDDIGFNYFCDWCRSLVVYSAGIGFVDIWRRWFGSSLHCF